MSAMFLSWKCQHHNDDMSMTMPDTHIMNLKKIMSRAASIRGPHKCDVPDNR